MDQLENNEIASAKFWIPTREVAAKLTKIEIECFYNTPTERLEGDTPYEFLLKTRDKSAFLDIFPLLRKSELKDTYLEMAPLDNKEFNYDAVYNKSGGVLNLYNPQVNEEMDQGLKELSAKSLTKREIINKWLNQPSELWSGLTPNLVWAGGGPVESKLLKDFLEFLSDTIKDPEFNSEGEALLESVRLLRAWQLHPNSICDHMSPYKAVLKERKEVFKRKIEFLKKHNIKADFTF